MLALCNKGLPGVQGHVKNLDKLWNHWIKNPDIVDRFSDVQGNFHESKAQDMLKFFAEFKLGLPFDETYQLSDKQVRRLEVEINSYGKDLKGKWGTIAGLVPEGFSKQDPAARKFYLQLNEIMNRERVNLNANYQMGGMVASEMLDAYVNAGMSNKYFNKKMPGLERIRELRKKMAEADPDSNVASEFEAEVAKILKSDEGKFIQQFSELVHMTKDGFKLAKTDPGVEYDPHVYKAVSHARTHLDQVGHVYLAGLDQFSRMLSLKLTGQDQISVARTNKQFNNFHLELESMKDQIKQGMERGGYFPRMMMESMLDMKESMSRLMLAKKGGHQTEMDNIVNNIFRQITPEAVPGHVKMRNPALNNAWDKDPLFVLNQYAKEAAQFNKLAWTQANYVEAMGNLPKADTKFIKGMKTFIDEEYTIFTKGMAGRPQWVNSLVHTMNAFQTARTMGFNITGAIKNATSAHHFMSSVGLRAITETVKSYNTDTERSIEQGGMRKLIDKYEKEAGFLFSDVSGELYSEGLLSRDKYRSEDIDYNPLTGVIAYQGTPIKDALAKGSDWTIGKLLTFHRLTENAQRKWMWRVAFSEKYKQLTSNGYGSAEAAQFSKRMALQTVNSWAYEYAAHAKAKPLRGAWEKVDELQGQDISMKQVGGGIAGGLSEMAFHLMHYPMSLAETHISQLKGAGKAAMARQWDADELRYMKNYAGVYMLVQLGSVLLNMDLNQSIENETINRLERVHDDMTKYDDPDKATFGLLSEVSGASMGHLKYLLVASGIIDLDSSTFNKIVFGNVDFSDREDQDVKRYEAYQISTEFGRWKNDQWPALRDGRGWDLLRNWTKAYPKSWIKPYRQKLGFPDVVKERKKRMTEEEKRRSAALKVLQGMS